MIKYLVKLMPFPRSSFLITIQYRHMTHKVFVYGTLKQNEPNHHWLTNPQNGLSKFIAKGTTKAKYPLIIATKYNIPFLLYSPGNGSNVKGEVYEVDETMLGNLDILEDHPNYYVREIDYIIVENKSTNITETLPCWVYFLKSFKPDLLNKPSLEDYSSTGPHGLPYMESNNESTIDDLDEVQGKTEPKFLRNKKCFVYFLGVLILSYAIFILPVLNFCENVSASLDEKDLELCPPPRPSPGCNRFFLYGTLKKDEPNHSILKDRKNGIAHFVAKGKTQLKYPMVIASKYNLPFVMYIRDVGYQIEGELYDIDDNMMCLLDKLEAHPEIYVRYCTDIVVGYDPVKKKDKIMKAWMYFLVRYDPVLLELMFLDCYTSEGFHGLKYKPRASNVKPLLDDPTGIVRKD